MSKLKIESDYCGDTLSLNAMDPGMIFYMQDSTITRPDPYHKDTHRLYLVTDEGTFVNLETGDQYSVDDFEKYLVGTIVNVKIKVRQ